MRRWLVALALIGVSGCGGGSKGGAVDPGALDACLAWSNGVCRLAFLCVDDPAAQDAAFKAHYGADMDACFTKLMARCQSNQSGSDVFGPSCGPGKVVNQTAVQTCKDNLDTLSCVDWMTGQDGNCGGICGTSSGNPDAGGGGMDGGGGTGPATPYDFCIASGNVTCDRGVVCDPSSGITAEYCKSVIAQLCVGITCTTAYNQQAGGQCIAALQSASCDVILNGPNPPSCDTSCP